MDLQQKFERIDGHFLSSIDEISNKLKEIHCFIFDWDGVFNDGVKRDKDGSPFSEPDSMGINMLRFSYWLIHKKLPFTAIITGENNITAVNFAERENFDAVLLNSKNKGDALTELTKEYGSSADQCVFIFDDILDLHAAEICHLSFCVRREASPLFNDYIVKNDMCDYISGHAGGENAIREITELLIGLNGNYDQTIEKRIKYAGEYEKYISMRKAVKTQVSSHHIS